MSAGSWARLLLLPAGAIAMRYSGDNCKLRPDGGMRCIMDVDTGGGDAMALIGMISHNKYVEAITVVAGNTNMENAYNNTMRVLKEIPVYKGADRPMIGRRKPEVVNFDADNFENVASIYGI